MRTVVAPHIELDERGIAYLDGTETKVLTVVQNKRMSRETPEQLRANMPHLSISQIYAALTYYHDHREELDQQIEDLDQKSMAILRQQPPGLSREELLKRRGHARSKTAIAG